MAEETLTATEALKRRTMAAPIIQAPQQDAAPRRPKMPDEMREQIQDLAEEMVQLNAPASQETGRVDLGPLPAGAPSTMPTAAMPAAVASAAPPPSNKIREGIERRCKPMDFGDLLLAGRVSQTVPILLAKLEVEFTSLTGVESYWMDYYAPPGIDVGSNAHVIWGLYARLALSISAVNGRQWEPIIQADGKVSATAVESRMAQLLRMSERVTNLLFTNLGWFNERVGKLFEDDFEALKNG